MVFLLLHATSYDLQPLHATALEYDFPRLVSCQLRRLFDHGAMDFHPLIAHTIDQSSQTLQFEAT